MNPQNQNYKVGYIFNDKSQKKTPAQRIAHKVLKYKTRQAYCFETGKYVMLREWYLFGFLLATVECGKKQYPISNIQLTMNPKFDITRFCPCPDGLEYYNGHSSFEQAWNDCPRGDWMLWIAQRLAVDPRVLTKAKALCANTVRHLMTDTRSTAAVDAALLYADGKITKEELQKYAYAAAADAYAAANAANAAADDAAYAAAYAAADAAAAAAAAAYAANAARAANRKETAKICREILTEAVFEKTNELTL